MTPADLHWLDAAVALAAPMLGTTAENPTVGAIVVDPLTNTMLGQGVTAPGGRPHAEPQALAMAGNAARGAMLYVTLEPCHHWGRTPPCVEAVLAAGIARVVIGMVDPDPRTAGESVKRLLAADVDVLVADHAPSRRLHEGFITRVTLGRPFITAKLAVSADGMIGRPYTPNVAITGPEAQAFTHARRAVSDAILVGGSTANIDNPRLSVRIPGLEDRRPLRVVLAGAQPLFANLNLFANVDSQRTVIIGLSGQRTPANIEFWPIPGTHRPDLADVFATMGAHGINSVLVEGGSALTEALLSAASRRSLPAAVLAPRHWPRRAARLAPHVHRRWHRCCPFSAG